MAEYVGSLLYLKFGATVISVDYKTFSEEHTVDTVDASAGSDTNRSYVTTLRDAKFSAELLSQTAGSVLWDALAPGQSGTLEWAPEGTATGKSKYQVVATVTNRSRDYAYDDIVGYKVEWVPTAGSTLTVGVY